MLELKKNSEKTPLLLRERERENSFNVLEV